MAVRPVAVTVSVASLVGARMKGRAVRLTAPVATMGGTKSICRAHGAGQTGEPGQPGRHTIVLTSIRLCMNGSLNGVNAPCVCCDECGSAQQSYGGRNGARYGDLLR
eukprot:5280427-Prymnesium_polylepis.1